jgi:two-component system, OmpR family, phosphate regulon sensor histidine kinase PhoR
MNRQRLVIIITLMSVALLGLIALQFYWVNNAVRLNEERFKQTIQEVLNNVVKSLERREALLITQQNIDRYTTVANKLTLKLDSTGMARWQEDKIIKSKRTLGNSPLSKGLEVQVEEEAVISKTGFARRLLYGQPILPENFKDIQARLLNDSINYTKHLQNQQILRYIDKSEMISVVLENLVNFDKPIEERISAKLLDSLIHAELMHKDINTKYIFGVVDTRNYQLLFDDTTADNAKMLRSGFQTQLFPNDEFAAPALLYLDFPEKNSFLLGEMLTVLGSSAIFVIIIIFSFASAVSIIIRQRKLSEMTNDFINNMTHEFKTPISTISLACDVMQDPDIRANEKQLDRYLTVIKDENERLGRQVEKVLQIASLGKGDFKLKIQPIDVNDVISKAMQNIAIQIESRGGMIDVDFQAEESVIEADEVHLSNIIYNLVDNANKYSPNAPEIKVTTESLKEGVLITVSDKGMGISKETINKVFEKFYRVSTGNVHNVKGFGLGLSYVKTMVEAHYGHIKVESELGNGSNFIIFFPYKHQVKEV